ncbi:MAG: fatty acid desaturase [Candidatus Tectimicrobiota bacterium]
MFHETLKKRVEQYFVDHNLSTSGDWRLFVKTAGLLGFLAAAYILLVFYATSWFLALGLVLALAQGLVLVSCNVMHDAAHESYARSKTVNRLMGYTLDLMGGSQMLWRQKHNIVHHTYTNIEGFDEDIQSNGLLRLHPQQPWRPWHRFQHLYAFAVYSLLTLSWVTVGDIKKLLLGRIGSYRLRRPGVAELSVFTAAKLLYFGYAIGLPLTRHSWDHVLLAFLGVHLIAGLTLSVIFQLAHTVEGVACPAPQDPSGLMERSWAEHELATTADFAPHNALATWYFGGLNFQIEHHLFTRICHRHYPAISRIVAETCREFRLPYACYPTVRAAIAGHYRFLQAMGRPAPSTMFTASKDCA